MEAAVACRGGGVLARPLPGHKARRHHGVGPARRRFLAVASLGEPPSAPSRDAVALAQEIALVDEYVPSTVIPDGELHFHSCVQEEIVLPLVRTGGNCLLYSAVIFNDQGTCWANLSSPDPVETVQVKFVLQKQCAFGQRFLVVGDDPALGLWDPTKATALEWSEHHVWTAKMDLPANKSVEFKFLLQDPSGHVSWQHGHNRTLQINETSNTLVVYEDWDDAKCQELSEVVYPSIGAEDVVHFAGSCNGAMLTDDNQVDVNQEIDEDLTVVVGTGGGSSPLREKLEANGANWSQFTLGEDQKVPEVLRRRANMAAQSGNPAADYAGRNGDNTLYEEGAPAENRPATMFENDMVWLGEALQRLLQSLGLKIGTTKT
uniref:Uncharacterized protein n=1 Tax=Avena sativa TaxID=4498 RepID=A0ACD5XAX6_AVESA